MTDGVLGLNERGVSVWLDDLSRGRLVSGELAQLITNLHVAGVTSNPTIFARALNGMQSDDYSAQVLDLAARGVSVEEAVRVITTYDVRWACDVLHDVFHQSGGQDGRVSLEVDPRLARDPAATIAEARALWWAVDRPNLMIKIPATAQCLSAIADATAEGISVNATLIFSLSRYQAVMDAYLNGLERAMAAGRDLDSIRSVASFFISRVDTEVDDRLEAIGSAEAASLRSKAATANARLAYAAYQDTFSGDRWATLTDAGAHRQRPLWASTSVKNPHLSNTHYVLELVAPGVVNTMPEATIRATMTCHTIPRDSVTTRYDDARVVMSALADVGVSYDDVVRVLEENGVAAFQNSWLELLSTLGSALESARS